MNEMRFVAFACISSTLQPVYARFFRDLSSQMIMLPNASFVGLGRWPFRLAVNGQAQAKMRR